MEKNENVEENKSEVEKLESETVKMQGLLDKKRRQLDELEQLRQREALGGKSALVAPQPRKELSPREYKDLVMRGIVPKE